jgi:hypothetical protein
MNFMLHLVNYCHQNGSYHSTFNITNYCKKSGIFFEDHLRYHAKFQDHTSNGTFVTLASQVLMLSVLILLMARN